MTSPTAAVLLINLGSPDAPTRQALRPYLSEFLSDPRVVDLPRWKWLPILHGIVLNTRPQRSAHAYRQIWQEDGAPLITISARQTVALRHALAARGQHIAVEYAMRYGRPSIGDALLIPRVIIQGKTRYKSDFGNPQIWKHCCECWKRPPVRAAFLLAVVPDDEFATGRFSFRPAHGVG